MTGPPPGQVAGGSPYAVLKMAMSMAHMGPPQSPCKFVTCSLRRHGCRAGRGGVRTQVAGMAPQAVLDRMQSMAPMRPTETMAQQALGGGAGGAYLAPALYRPVVQAGLCPLLHDGRLYHCARSGVSAQMVQGSMESLRYTFAWVLP